jgi:hypothetical protein
MKKNRHILERDKVFIASLSWLFVLGCQSPPPPATSSAAPELEVPDVSIPWQKSGKISSSLLEVQVSSKNSDLIHENIEFQKIYVEYPLRPHLKTLISSVEFSGPHSEIWQNWNQRVLDIVEKIKNELRKDPTLELQLEKMNSLQRPRGASSSALREVPFSRVEIEFLPQGYELIFRSEIPGLFEYRLRLESKN